jgi:hypothetical protein
MPLSSSFAPNRDNTCWVLLRFDRDASGAALDAARVGELDKDAAARRVERDRARGGAEDPTGRRGIGGDRRRHAGGRRRQKLAGLRVGLVIAALLAMSVLFAVIASEAKQSRGKSPVPLAGSQPSSGPRKRASMPRPAPGLTREPSTAKPALDLYCRGGEDTGSAKGVRHSAIAFRLRRWFRREYCRSGRRTEQRRGCSSGRTGSCSTR